MPAHVHDQNAADMRQRDPCANSTYRHDLRLPDEGDVGRLRLDAVEVCAKLARERREPVQAAALLKERGEVRQDERRGEDARARGRTLLEVARVGRRVRAQEEARVPCPVHDRPASPACVSWRSAASDGAMPAAPVEMTSHRASRSDGNLATGLQKLWTLPAQSSTVRSKCCSSERRKEKRQGNGRGRGSAHGGRRVGGSRRAHGTYVDRDRCGHSVPERFDLELPNPRQVLDGMGHAASTLLRALQLMYLGNGGCRRGVLEDDAQFGKLAVDLFQVRQELLLRVQDADVLLAWQAATDALISLTRCEGRVQQSWTGRPPPPASPASMAFSALDTLLWSLGTSPCRLRTRPSCSMAAKTASYRS